tara:strand:- start:1365 stop:1964 length:600 start_codon:yes stop_codon:yes gene_type:complete
MNYIDLFSGTGAFSYVLKNNKFKCKFSNDMEISSEKIYKLNFPKHNFVLEDLNNINIKNIPKHDILCAGFPCQPFSIAGKKKGFDDKRANVFWKIIEILKKYKPNIIILENVKNLKTHDKGKTYNTIITNLEEIGYNIKSEILDTCKITVIPHHRERIYIIGFLDKKHYNKFNFDFPQKKQQKNIIDFLEQNIDEKYYR